MKLSPEAEAEMIRRGAVVVPKPVRLTQEPAQLTSTTKSTFTQKPTNLSTCSPCQSLWIPNWTPGLLNQWDGRHWSVRAKIKKADRTIVGLYAGSAFISPAHGPRRVSMMFILPKGKRMFDRDAPLKSCLDALVHCGALMDDTPKLCLIGPVSYARAIGAESVVGTLILMEDI